MLSIARIWQGIRKGIFRSRKDSIADNFKILLIF
jgi:hypothetical protein